MLEATVGKAYRHDVPATDANGDILTYSLAMVPVAKGTVVETCGRRIRAVCLPASLSQ